MDTTVALDEDEAQLIRVAALLHDITHIPFGHTLEDERRLFPRHDKGARLGKLLQGGLEGLGDSLISGLELSLTLVSSLDARV